VIVQNVRETCSYSTTEPSQRSTSSASPESQTLPTRGEHSIPCSAFSSTRPVLIIGFLHRHCNDYILETSSAQGSLTPETLKQYTGAYQARDPTKYDRFAKKFLAALPQFAVPHLEQGQFSEYDAKVIFPFIEEVEIGKKPAEDGRSTSEGANGAVSAFKMYRGYQFPVGCSIRSSSRYDADFNRKPARE
jgi:hypothetical protein